MVTSPNIGTGNNILYGAAAVSSSDVWAVGYYRSNLSAAETTLIEHYNGTSWSTVSSPNGGSGNNELWDISVVSASDIWAVGFHANDSGVYQTLIVHYNGTSWSTVSSPNTGSQDNFLFGVSAVSSNTVWAVGYYLDNSGIANTLIEKWDGSSWSTVTSPNSGSEGSKLYGVAKISSSDVWAAAYYLSSGTKRTLTEHYNGTSWSVVTSANSGTGNNTLTSVGPVSSSYVWAMGDYVDTTTLKNRTLAEKWNGTSWSVVSTPNGSTYNNFLIDVSVVPGTTPCVGGDTWAVGIYRTSTGTAQTLIERYTIGSCSSP